MPPATPPSKINASRFYVEWAGHPLEDLKTALALIRDASLERPIVYFAGDSSLDNKAWVPSAGPGGEPLPTDVPEIYQAFLQPPRPKPDVAFWLNHILGKKATVLNAAVEASLLRHRDDKLLPHDEFIRDNIGADDILVVSVGANDIALSPTISTMRHVFHLAWLTPFRHIKNGSASSLSYFKTMFHDQMKSYISRLVSETKPKAVIPCMIYFPLEHNPAAPQESWAEPQLKMLGYNRDPAQLREAIKKMYEQATAKVEIEGTKVVPCALFEAMDGKEAKDYTARVEPSAQGGRKMAELIAKKIEEAIE